MTLHSRATEPRPLDPADLASEGRPVGRRVALCILGLSAAGILFGSRVQSLLERVAPADAGGLLSVLPVGRFRIYSVTRTLPERHPADYRLRLTGLVDRPLDLSLADLRALPSTRLTRDFQCVTGWRVRSVAWKGVLLSELLERAGSHPGAAGCRFVSFDGTYTESLTMEQARRPDVLVAYEMEGRPLSRAHGGPARIYVAPMYGYKSCKWLEEISVEAGLPPGRQGYWEDYGYDTDGWVGKSNGRSDPPT